MKKFIRLSLPLFSLAISLALSGCGGSEPAVKESEAPPQPSATEILQKEMNDLKTENNVLNKRVVTLEQDKRIVTAHAAELETELAELKEKQAAAIPPPQRPVVSEPAERYKEALTLFHSRRYPEAAELFRQVIDGGNPERLLDNCYYWIGECLFGEKRYKEAIEQFTKVFTFRISEKKDESQIMIANCYLAMGDKAKAKEGYEALLRKFPASPYVKIAKDKLGKI